jgi:hypothetical protein
MYKCVHVADRLSPDTFRGRLSFTVDDEHISERQFNYYANRLVEEGLAEKRVKSIGLSSWTIFRLKQSNTDTYTAITGLPF